MGLAAVKNKRKLGVDPNNTRWSRNANLFGQRMMRSQGWEPGQHLGVQGAAHAERHSQASYAGVRVVLKDDQLGLGAKKGSADECTGLVAFASLLGRLNGKEGDEKWEADQRARADMQRRLHVEKKLGTIEFVKGGWLVGDDMREAEEEEEGASETKKAKKATATTRPGSETEQPRPSKKRKTGQDGDDGRSGSDRPVKKTRKGRKEKTDDGFDDNDGERKERGKEKKRKKEKKQKTAAVSDGETVEARNLATAGPDPVASSNPVDPNTRRISKGEAGRRLESKEARSSRRKKDKEGRKLSKSERKKQRMRDAEEPNSGAWTPPSDETQSEPAISTLLSTAESTPAPSGSSTPVPHTISNRRLSNRKFIAQKRLALVDPAALNQIFQIKSS